MTDRTAFGVGVCSLALALLATWLQFGSVDWRLVGVATPVVLIGIGVGMLLLSRKTHT